jgi:hypothetical protein
MDPKASRGYRNKNPGNIDFNPANAWEGQTGRGDHWLPVAQQRFAEFDTHEHGIRALARLLLTYQTRHGLNTVRQIIHRWAPPVENDSGAYVTAVARALSMGRDAPLDLQSYAVMRPLVEAIIRHELGGQPYTDAQLDRGLEMAGIQRPVTTLREAAATGTGRAAITTASVTAAAAAAAPVITAMGALPEWTGVALVLAGALLAALLILSRRRDG